MDTLQTIIIAIVEGLTEFLPVSSTGHMIIAQNLLGVESTPFVKAFTFIIQFGAILSVLCLYWKRFFQLNNTPAPEGASALKKLVHKYDFYWKLFIAFIPAAVFGLLFSDAIDAMLERVEVVAVTLVLGGVFMLFCDRIFNKGSEDTPFTEKRALMVGLFQCISTLVVSCQAPNRSLIQMMCDEADQTIYMNGLNDGAMLEPLRETIAADTSDLFVVMHCYGSHFNYRERYPNQFSQFTPDDDVSISKKNRERMVNAYDNSIIYTDWFISEVISTLRQTDACSAMFYCADHGEDLYDDRRGRFLHSSPTITYYQAHVACVGWYSDEWRATYPEKAEAAAANTMAPASTHTVFHTTAQLAPIESPYIKPEVSLVSNEFDYAVERHTHTTNCYCTNG